MGKLIEDSIAAGQAYLDALASKTSTEWPEPRPIKSELPPAPSFDAGLLLPAALATYVADEADRMPCAPDFIAASLLVSKSIVWTAWVVSDKGGVIKRYA